MHASTIADMESHGSVGTTGAVIGAKNLSVALIEINDLAPMSYGPNDFRALKRPVISGGIGSRVLVRWTAAVGPTPASGNAE